MDKFYHNKYLTIYNFPSITKKGKKWLFFIKIIFLCILKPELFDSSKITNKFNKPWILLLFILPKKTAEDLW